MPGDDLPPLRPGRCPEGDAQRRPAHDAKFTGVGRFATGQQRTRQFPVQEQQREQHEQWRQWNVNRLFAEPQVYCNSIDLNVALDNATIDYASRQLRHWDMTIGGST